MVQNQWQKKEVSEIEKFFRNEITELTLYKRLHKINPDRTFKSMQRKIEDYKARGWNKAKDNALKKLRVGYLDIEASNLNADFGVILSWFIKEKGKSHYDSDVIKKDELFNQKFDNRVVKSLLNAMNTYDVIYTHWGKDRRFDVPFIRTRAYKNNLQDLIPKKGSQFIMDTWDIAKNKLKLHSNRLGSIAEVLNIKNVKKTPLSGDVWSAAMYGDKKALDYIYLHNKRDVQILEKVAKKLENVERPIYRSI